LSKKKETKGKTKKKNVSIIYKYGKPQTKKHSFKPKHKSSKTFDCAKLSTTIAHKMVERLEIPELREI